MVRVWGFFNLESFLDFSVLLNYTSSVLFLFGKSCTSVTSRDHSVLSLQTLRRKENRLQYLKQCKYEKETESLEIFYICIPPPFPASTRLQ